MKRFIWLVLLLSACNVKPTNVLTNENLITQSFRINTKADTTVITTEGVVVTIPANAISASTATVTLVIKEALSLSDMIQAGLTTQTKDGTLSSNGMFYINTKEPSTILKPLQIKVPADYADTAMRLYKGVADKDRMLWEAPEALNTSESKAILQGEILFNQNCRSCHDVKRKLIGPALANVENRWEDRKLLFEWIRNPFAVLHDGDPYATCLFCEYNKTAMTAYPAFTDNDIEGILAFINRETIRLHLKELPGQKVSDSVRYYQRYYKELIAKRVLFAAESEHKVIADIVAPEQIISGGKIDTAIYTQGKAPVDTKVVVPDGRAEFYQLTVKAYGWYNIDAKLSEMGTVKSRLAVRMNSNYSQTINMYLVIPAYKVFAQGGLLDNATEYGFYDENGGIYLPQSKEAFIIAVGEEKGQIFYGQQSFVIKEDQTVEIAVTAVSEAEMKASLKKLALENVDISARKLIHVEDVKQIDREIERIRKLAHICDCMVVDSSQ